MEITICPLCGNENVAIYCSSRFSASSTGEILPYPVQTYYCDSCATLFKKRSSDDFVKIASLYASESYTLHDVNDYTEQRVAYDKTRGGINKTLYELEFLFQTHIIPAHGRLLDIGCHYGALLRFFQMRRPEWQLIGYDVNERYREHVEALGETVGYHCGDISVIDGTFDIIILSHVMEHVYDPSDLLGKIRLLLAEDGLIFIQSNNSSVNPFLHFIYEQHFNFTLFGLRKLLSKKDLGIVCCSTEWLPKEFSVLVKRNEICSMSDDTSITDAVDALHSNANIMRDSFDAIACLVSRQVICGVFGTSYSGRCLGKELGSLLAFFVDEDAQIQGRMLMGVPVLAPEQVPLSMPILVSLPPKAAEQIIKRLKQTCPGFLFAPPFSGLVQ